MICLHTRELLWWLAKLAAENPARALRDRLTASGQRSHYTGDGDHRRPSIKGKARQHEHGRGPDCK